MLKLPQSQFASWGTLLLFLSLCLPGLCCSRIVLALGTLCLGIDWMQSAGCSGRFVALITPAAPASPSHGALSNTGRYLIPLNFFKKI